MHVLDYVCSMAATHNEDPINYGCINLGILVYLQYKI